ncbi:MAG: hypothetical protein P1V34_08115 [Alphaproteobacteria bacterium]|nr:hypothetical protein [Alphaproteobacteria bacterium]
MSFHYLIPLIFSLPPEYEFKLTIPLHLIRLRLADTRSTVLIRAVATVDAKTVWSEEVVLDMNSANDGSAPVGFDYSPFVHASGGPCGFMEVEFLSKDESPIFNTKAPPELYGLYHRDGCPSFRADGSYKFGAPSVIASITEYGAFVESYPTIKIDRVAGLHESLSLVNPYAKALLVSGAAMNGQGFRRVKVPARSAIRLDLDCLVPPGADRTETRLQITATNRVLTYHVRHDASNQIRISDHEHLDIFRADPTHIPLSLYLRERFARILKQRYGIRIAGKG